jgi:DNA polymerase III subunit epsilon
MREIIFDTETTGLSPTDGHRLVEIGCIEMVNRVETGRTFHSYVNPARPMPPEAQAIHGLSDAFLADKPAFAAIHDELLAFLGEARMIAHNAAFDFAFLNAELDQCGRPRLGPERMVDTLALARARHPGAKHSLDALCARFGIDRSQRVKHGALVDAQLLAQVYVELTGGRQIGLALVAEPSAVGLRDVAAVTVIARPPRPHVASVEERARHAAFVALLVDPLWRQLEGLG